ncbi:MAG TPA: glycosyltransferase family 2 protein [Brevundimonas sp.]|jgi:glycosyltransferase involved in cell wall biosynthesis|uniref:glycosyltransferase family 2 protein n=1 Tax=Brevundimonas sp. TaxID=1871086 RepID=UPI002DF53E1F|nr:glycosyltransferase family 2 protein [Brevundimonas sp.]
MSPRADLFDNPAWPSARPRLSVLIPFLRDDPMTLLAALGATPTSAAELIVLDDGTGDPDLTARLKLTIRDLALPARLVTLPANEGRSRGRNRLAQAARGGHLLFLDSDMLPDATDFLAEWVRLVETEDPAVAFGGFSLKQASTDRRFAVHRAMAGRSETLDAATRAKTPEKYVFTSNLLVRRDVFEAEAFDPGFAGWGWEDVEWAMRVSRRWPVRHVDITATHMGLDDAAALAGKYEQSAANFARVVQRHFDLVSSYPSYRVARRLKALPGLALLRPWLKRLALSEAAPVGARAFSLRLYRAALYADRV